MKYLPLDIIKRTQIKFLEDYCQVYEPQGYYEYVFQIKYLFRQPPVQRYINANLSMTVNQSHGK